MSITIIDSSNVHTLLAQAVALKGVSHVQDECVYIETLGGSGEETEYGPGCIAGTVFWLANKEATLKTFAPDVCANRNLLDFVSDMLIPNGMVVTLVAQEVLRLAQEAQDGRVGTGRKMTWGETLVYALTERIPN